MKIVVFHFTSGYWSILRRCAQPGKKKEANKFSQLYGFFCLYLVPLFDCHFTFIFIFQIYMQNWFQFRDIGPLTSLAALGASPL